MDHSFQDAVSLELARRIANGLPEHPEWLDLGRANLNRWTQRNSNALSVTTRMASAKRLQCVHTSARNPRLIGGLVYAETNDKGRVIHDKHTAMEFKGFGIAA